LDAIKISSPQIDRDRLARIFKALGHPTRIKIVEHLIRINSCICGDIVGIFPFSQSTISQHLKQLKDSGIVKGTIDGPSTCYCVDKDILKEFKGYVAALGLGIQDYEAL
jgi:ArsR family transcriptional regulator